MYWNDFLHNLKGLSSRLWVNFGSPARHDQYPELLMFGIEYDRKHICSVTYGQDVPLVDAYDGKGILTHKGQFRILDQLLSAEWVPGLEYRHYKPRYYRENNESWFQAEIDARKIEKLFRISLYDIKRKKWDREYLVRERSSSISLA